MLALSPWEVWLILWWLELALDIECGLLALWWSLPCLGQDLLPSCWGRSPQLYFWAAFLFKNVFIFFFWLCWVFVAVNGLSSCGEMGLLSSCDTRAAHCSGFSCCGGALALRCMSISCCSSRGSGNMAQGLSCPVICGIFPNQRSNPCPLYCKADQGKPLSCTWSVVWGKWD